MEQGQNDLIEALKESDEKYRLLIENSDDIIYTLSPEGIFTFVSPAWTKLLGHPLDQVVNHPFQPFVHPDDLPACILLLQDMSDPDNKQNTIDYRAKHSDGSWHWHSSKAVNMLDENGEFLGFLGIARDITERKKMENSLRTSEAQLSNGMIIAKLGCWEYNVDDDLFTFNDHFYDIFRTNAKKVGGYRMSAEQYARQFVHPDDSSMVGTEIQKAIETTDPNFSHQIDHRIIYADGETGYISVRFFIVKDYHGRTIKTYGVNQDITERKQAEELLQESEKKYITFIDSSPDLIYLKDENLEHIVVNKSLCEFYNKSLNEIIGKTDFDLMDKIYAGNCRLSDDNTIKTNKIVVTVEKLDNMTFETIKFPVEYKIGKIGVGGFIRNITERSKAEKDLKNKMNELRQMNELMVDREIKMVELKEEINEMLKKEGKEEKYEV